MEEAQILHFGQMGFLYLFHPKRSFLGSPNGHFSFFEAERDSIWIDLIVPLLPIYSFVFPFFFCALPALCSERVFFRISKSSFLPPSRLFVPCILGFGLLSYKLSFFP